MKKLICIIVLFVCTQVFANMANPVIEGTFVGRPFVSEFVDVTHEDLLIKVHKGFDYATFNVQYHINASKEGHQIPFLFYASEYLDSFSVKVDGKEISISDIPYDFNVPEGSKFKDFSYFFERDSSTYNSSVLIKNSSNSDFYVSLNDMVYFETDIPKGRHLIEVSYKATKWTDKFNWVNEYSFRYALSPAKYWKSFGTLTIKIDAIEFNEKLNVNFGPAKIGDINSKAEWEFNALPQEILHISYTPKVSKTTETLINIGPEGLAIITGGLLGAFYLLIVYWYRKKNPEKRFSIVVIIGCILLPLLLLVCWMKYYYLIDTFIGEHAGRMHGYTFFLIGLYPILAIIYWFVFWKVDRRLKKKFNHI